MVSMGIPKFSFEALRFASGQQMGLLGAANFSFKLCPTC